MKILKDVLKTLRSKLFYSRLFYEDRTALIIETELEAINSLNKLRK